MYLLMNENEKIVLNTIEEFSGYNLNNYKVYSLVPVDQADLVNDGQIRDEISRILKGNEITKEELIERVNYQLDIPKSRISKVEINYLGWSNKIDIIKDNCETRRINTNYLDG